MARSMFDAVADAAHRRPEWIEQDGDHEVLVQGFSLFESLAALLAGTIIIAAAIAVLAVMP